MKRVNQKEITLHRQKRGNRGRSPPLRCRSFPSATARKVPAKSIDIRSIRDVRGKQKWTCALVVTFSHFPICSIYCISVFQEVIAE